MCVSDAARRFYSGCLLPAITRLPFAANLRATPARISGKLACLEHHVNGGKHMLSSSVISFIAASAIMLSSLPSHADATLVVQGSDGLQSMIQLRNGKGKMSAAGRDEYVIYDAVARTVTYVEPQLRRYMQVNEELLEANVQTAANLQQAVEPYMARMMAGMSPAQRSMIEQRMGVALGPPAAGREPATDIKTVDRGSHSIAGLRCNASGVVKNGRPAAEVCMATAASGKLSEQDFATLESIVTFSRGMASSAKGLLGDLAVQLEFLATNVDGVPVAVRDLENDRRYQVTAVSNAALSDALFDGYGQFERREMPTLLR